MSGGETVPKGFTQVMYEGDRWMIIGNNQDGKLVVRWFKGNATFVEAPILSLAKWAEAFETLLKRDEIGFSPDLVHLSLAKRRISSGTKEILSEATRAIFEKDRKIVIGPMQFTRMEDEVNPNACAIKLLDGRTRVSEVPLELLAEFAAWLLSDPILTTEIKHTQWKDVCRPWLRRRMPIAFDDKGFLLQYRKNDFVTEPEVLAQPAVPVPVNNLKGEVVVAVTEKPKVETKPKAEENPAGVFLWCLSQTLKLTENSPEWVPPGFSVQVKKLVIGSAMTYLSGKGVIESKPAEVMDIAQAEAKLRELQEKLERESVVRLTVLQREVNHELTDLATQRADLAVQIASLKSAQDVLARERAEFEGAKLKWSQEKAALEEQMELMQVMLGSAEANVTS